VYLYRNSSLLIRIQRTILVQVATSGAFSLLFLIAACNLVQVQVFAQRFVQDDKSAESTLTAPDLENFLGAFVPDQLRRLEIAGAVAGVVKDGHVLLSRGYGLADIESKLPMSDSTLVRPASISKLFTAIAVLQLVAQGKLDLDRDVNDYLDFRIPTLLAGTPVTLRLLLSHRAGFEDHLKNVFAAGGSPEPLSVWLPRNLPHRLFPNGDVPAYSNYGYGVAGFIVERASGERFEDYAASHILKPLGMEHSTFEQPLPDALRALVARGYRRSTGDALPYFEVLPASVGGLSASAADMGRFMLALLARNPVLEPGTSCTPSKKYQSLTDSSD
jgi:CubicO group peptidase (beta-lactamase class C family)